MKQGARNLKDGSTKKLLLVLLLTAVLRGQNSGTTVSITDTDEVRAGQILAEEFAQNEGMRSTPQTTKIDEYLQAVGDRVAARAQRKLPYRFHFDPSPAFKSAVGLPGGQIFVGDGILAYMDSEDQLAAVLGHEVEHIALNQCRDRLIKVLAEKHLSTDKLEELKVDDFLPGYGHDNELAADREGVKLATEAGYSPKGAIRLLRTFVILGQQMPNTPAEGQKRLEERIGQIETLSNQREVQVSEKPLSLP
jgi:beta-barrel assembly-enhancing protease